MGKWRLKKKSKRPAYRDRNRKDISNPSILHFEKNKNKVVCNKCRLCNKKDAIKKGSHIVPHFLLKRIENIEGKQQRDSELSFTIGKMGASSSFGRSIQPEKLAEIYGEISDEDIAKNRHQLVVDNYFCPDCENRFSLIESEYSKTIYKKNTDIYESGVSSILGILFWGSVVWRMSNHGKSGARLTTEQEESLRNIIDKYLPRHNIKEIETLKTENLEDISKVSYKLIRFNDCDKNDSKFLFADPEFDKSFVLLIDEYALALSFNDDYTDFEKSHKLGLENIFANVEKNGVRGKERIVPLPKSAYTCIQAKIVHIAIEQYLAYAVDVCNVIYKEIGGMDETMPQAIKQEIIEKLINTEPKLGRKYTKEHLLQTILEVLKTHTLKQLNINIGVNDDIY